MANIISTQLLQDGPRNAVVKFVAVLDTADITNQLVVAPDSLSSMQPAFSGYPVPATVAIKAMEYRVSGATVADLQWDATSPVLVEAMSGNGKSDYREVGFLQNNAGAGVTGNITLTTRSNATPSTSNIISVTLVLWLIKQLPGPGNTNIPFLGAMFSSSANSSLIPILPL